MGAGKMNRASTAAKFGGLKELGELAKLEVLEERRFFPGTGFGGDWSGESAKILREKTFERVPWRRSTSQTTFFCYN